MPEDLTRGFVQLFLEVEAGLRPRRHIVGVMCPVLVARISGNWVLPGPTGVLVRVHGEEPTPGVYEAVALVRRGARFGAIGVRLARRGMGWRVEDVVRPELGPLPPAPHPVGEIAGTDKQDAGGRRRSPRNAPVLDLGPSTYLAPRATTG